MIKLKSPVPKSDPVVIDPINWSSNNVVKLPYPEASMNVSFGDVLEKRKTRRQFKNITKDEVGYLLYMANRTLYRDRNSQGILTEHRPVISSGGLHVVECLVLFPGENVWNRYDSLNHQFQRLYIDHEKLSNLALNARGFFETSNIAAVIWYVGDFTRISGKYDHAQSAMWRDSGAIQATHSLVSEYLNYAFCPLGITGQDEAQLLSDQRNLLGLGLSLVGLM